MITRNCLMKQRPYTGICRTRESYMEPRITGATTTTKQYKQASHPTGSYPNIPFHVIVSFKAALLSDVTVTAVALEACWVRYSPKQMAADIAKCKWRSLISYLRTHLEHVVLKKERRYIPNTHNPEDRYTKLEHWL
ncbi:uncharacterized protein LOC142234973 isoform X1 [Haematobia irritans]|uniref:uncharacterized protein LOC142234973 isoform X1 n=1 Tax=Haematobia irritans TaxID=7368 RepID=UPI003F50A510